MRKLLPSLLVLLLLSLLTAAASAHALSLPGLPGDPLAAIEDETEEPETEEADEPETEDDEPEPEEGCEDDQEDCEGLETDEECVLEEATAKVAPQPGDSTVRLTIRYQAFAPAAVAIDTRLRGSQGRLHLGSRHTHFHRAGVYRDSFALGEKQMQRALAAREFTVELKAVNTPRYCRLDLTGAPRQSKRSLRAGAPGRSGDRGRTHGRSGRSRLR